MQKRNRTQSRLRQALWLVPGIALPLSLGLAQELTPKVSSGQEATPQEATPQEGELEPWEKMLDKLPGSEAQSSQADARKEMEEAFQRVELGLEQMNVLLLEASKGDTTRLLDAKGAGIDELLRLADKRPQGDPTGALAELLYASSAEGQRVLDGIDQILEIAAKNGDPNSC